MHESLFDKLYSTATFAAAILAANLVALFKVWPLIKERINERHRDAATEKAGDWSRLRAEINRLDERCDHLQSEVDSCREREGEWMHRALEAEAIVQGFGEVRQLQALTEAMKRIKPPEGDK